MKKRLSSFIAGFLVASQILLSCVGMASVRAEDNVGSTETEISSAKF